MSTPSTVPDPVIIAVNTGAVGQRAQSIAARCTVDDQIIYWIRVNELNLYKNGSRTIVTY